MKAIQSPHLFKSLVFQFSAEFDGSEAEREILPEELRGAAPKRRAEFLAGRFCARKAFELAGVKGAEIAIGKGRSPVWPEGFVGSITHKDVYCSAVIARRSEVYGIGMDAEVRMSASAAARVEPRVLIGTERKLGESLGIAPEEFVTLVFSAKESVFKCLAPHVGRYFGFASAELTEVDLRRGEFIARVLEDLSPLWATGRELVGRFVIEKKFIHTGVEWVE